MSPLLLAVLGMGAAVAPDVKAPMSQPGTSRIAVVNIGLVFNKYDRAKAFKADLETSLQPYKNKAAKITKSMKTWEEAIASKDFEAASKEEYEEKIVKAKRELEDMSRQISARLGKKQEENLVTLWKEVNLGISTYAQHHNIDIVLGYGDPMEKEMLDLFPNVNRKMQAMDLGSTVPLFVRPGADISEPVAQMLNRWVREAKRNLPKLAPIDLD